MPPVRRSWKQWLIPLSRRCLGRLRPEQALRFAESLARGEPNRGKIALTVASDKVRELV